MVKLQGRCQEGLWLSSAPSSPAFSLQLASQFPVSHPKAKDLSQSFLTCTAEVTHLTDVVSKGAGEPCYLESGTWTWLKKKEKKFLNQKLIPAYWQQIQESPLTTDHGGLLIMVHLNLLKNKKNNLKILLWQWFLIQSKEPPHSLFTCQTVQWI